MFLSKIVNLIKNNQNNCTRYKVWIIFNLKKRKAEESAIKLKSRRWKAEEPKKPKKLDDEDGRRKSQKSQKNSFSCSSAPILIHTGEMSLPGEPLKLASDIFMALINDANTIPGIIFVQAFKIIWLKYDFFIYNIFFNFIYFKLWIIKTCLDTKFDWTHKLSIGRINFYWTYELIGRIKVDWTHNSRLDVYCVIAQNNRPAHTKRPSLYDSPKHGIPGRYLVKSYTRS